MSQTAQVLHHTFGRLIALSTDAGIAGEPGSVATLASPAFEGMESAGGVTDTYLAGATLPVSLDLLRWIPAVTTQQ